MTPLEKLWLVVIVQFVWCSIFMTIAFATTCFVLFDYFKNDFFDDIIVITTISIGIVAAITKVCCRCYTIKLENFQRTYFNQDPNLSREHHSIWKLKAERFGSGVIWSLVLVGQAVVLGCRGVVNYIKDDLAAMYGKIGAITVFLAITVTFFCVPSANSSTVVALRTLTIPKRVQYDNGRGNPRARIVVNNAEQ